MKMKAGRETKKSSKHVRRAEDFNLEDLGVSIRTQALLDGLDERELLFQIRVSAPRKKSIPSDCYSEVKQVADSEGFIRHDFDERTFGLMRLYGKVLNSFEEQGIFRSVCDFESNEEYESFVNYSKEKIKTICDFLKSELQEDEYEILKLRYGFGEDATPRNCAEVARLKGLNYKEVNRICTNAEKILKYPSRLSSFRTFIQMSN